MTRFPDEEPDVDELDDWDEREELHAQDLCARCGHDDHRTRGCPNVPPGGGS